MINKEKVKHIACLVKLSLTLKEEEKFQKELSSILDYIEQLKEVDTTNVAPASQFLGEVFDSKEQVLTRKDEIEKQDIEVVNKLLELAPETKQRSFKVKPIFSQNKKAE